MTNYEKIKSLSVEELAELIVNEPWQNACTDECARQHQCQLTGMCDVTDVEAITNYLTKETEQ